MENDYVDMQIKDDMAACMKKKIKQAKKEEGMRRAKVIAEARRKADDEAKPQSEKEKSQSNRHGGRNQRRHQKLAKWILETFDFLEEGSVVVDVAGGKGELAARLSYCHKINVCIIDPRKADVSKCFIDVVLPKLPKKWQQIYLEKSGDNQETYLRDDVIEKRVNQIVSNFDSSIFDAPNLSDFPMHKIDKSLKNDIIDVVSNCSLMIGMHADSATEAIVDVAMAYNKPFVVVPCCVFPKLFDNRILDGKKVTTHEQFCQYLVKKDSRLRMETLPFDGRNTAIWWNPNNSNSNRCQ